MSDSRGKPARRKRYPGRNPRSFADKYKEHQPERYPEDVAKVVEHGRTPAGMHRPIMVAEILEALELVPGQVVLDCTLGYGGHASEMLKAILPGGRLLGMDLDPVELARVEIRLRALISDPKLGDSNSILVRRANFAGITSFLASAAPQGVDAILADFGVSSMQIDDPARGFSFKLDGPLDMRMNPLRGKSATDWLSDCDQNQIQIALVENADEPRAEELARLIHSAHAKHPIGTTRELCQLIRAELIYESEEERDKTVRRVFQAFRIAVNDELRSIDSFLSQLPFVLKPGGKVAILTFHSGEDRRVKSAFKLGFQTGHYRNISREVVRATAAEQRSNSRSCSAKLRVATR